MITVTFIRHGESEDNPRGIWAGWKDAPLSALGRKQAQAVGKAFSGVKLDYIYSSPLLRASATGQAVRDAQPSPQLPFTANPNLREQHFGIAEGHPWVVEVPAGQTEEDMIANNVFPVLSSRSAKFPEGESLDDLARRAETGIKECVLPHVLEDDVHIAIASHGLCISELIAALLRLDPDSRRDVSYIGLLNTAWTRVTVSVKGGHVGPLDPENSPPLTVRVTDVNKYDHLNDIPSFVENEDESQAAARAFFGGGGKTAPLLRL